MQAFDYSKVKDPQYFCENRMEAHSDHVNYRDVKKCGLLCRKNRYFFPTESEWFMEIPLCP